MKKMWSKLFKLNTTEENQEEKPVVKPNSTMTVSMQNGTNVTLSYPVETTDEKYGGWVPFLEWYAADKTEVYTFETRQSVYVFNRSSISLIEITE